MKSTAEKALFPTRPRCPRYTLLNSLALLLEELAERVSAPGVVERAEGAGDSGTVRVTGTDAVAVCVSVPSHHHREGSLHQHGDDGGDDVDSNSHNDNVYSA